MQLNDEQRQAVEFGDGICIVTSTPGSGKTRTLTERVIRLIEKGVSSSNILCVTFTNKAADEMRQRVLSRLPEAKDVWISTFHKFCLGVLRRFGTKGGIYPNFTIMTDTNQFDLTKKIARMHEQEFNNSEIDKICSAANTYRENLLSWSDFKADLEDEYDWKGSVYLGIIKEYFETLQSNNVVDFSGILYICYKILSECPEVLEKISNKFKYVLVDEGQDTNIIQYEILKLIAKQHNNLFVVADENQSLYGFRGSCPENLKKIKEDFADTKEMFLPKNYRSTTKILKVAESLIKNNPGTEHVRLESTREEGEDVRVYSLPNPDAEANFVCHQILKLVEEGINYNDIAILYRSNALSKVIEQKCRSFNIPYEIIGGFSFFDRKEIKDLMAYITLLINPLDSTAFHRAISNPTRGLGDVAIGRIERACQNHKCNIFEVCDNHIEELKLSHKAKQAFIKFCNLYKTVPSDPVDAIKHILDESGYIDDLTRQKTEEADNRQNNLAEFLSSVFVYKKKNPQSTLQNFLEYIALQNIEQSKEETDKVKLLTVHAAKGLEFSAVFLISAEEGILPHRLSMEREEDIHEERRIMYVGITRAMNRLTITYCKERMRFGFGKFSEMRLERRKPSRFLEEMQFGKQRFTKPV